MARPRSEKKPVKPTSVKIEPVLKEKVRRISKEEHRSMSAQIIMWILRGIAEHDGDRKRVVVEEMDHEH